MERLVIVGAGGFGREVFSLICEINQVRETWDAIGFLDDNPAALDGFSHYPPVLGPIDHYRNLQSARVTCAVGSPKARKRIVARLNGQGARWATIVHPTVRLGIGSTLGEGCILCIRSGLTVDVRVGNHVHINCVAGAGHDARIGDFCTLSGHVDVCGHAVVEEGVFFGSHAVVLPGVRIGAGATVGAGSIVMSDVAPNKTVFGAPAREIFTRPTTPPADGDAPTGKTGKR
jgi:sugar O-acyltransferase (sialic acid O-acetyltransferase NeuD family)